MTWAINRTFEVLKHQQLGDQQYYKTINAEIKPYYRLHGSKPSVKAITCSLFVARHPEFIGGLHQDERKGHFHYKRQHKARKWDLILSILIF